MPTGFEPYDAPVGSPSRDPWDEYALEKVRAQIIEDEFHLEDQNRGFTVYAVVGVLGMAGAVIEVFWRNGPASLWQATFFLGMFVLTVCCITLRIYGGMLLRRIQRRQKWLDKHGVKLL